jgi:hypothetical protein
VFVALGNVVLEPFVGDFQDLLFDESQFLFKDWQGKCPLIILHICPLYSIDVELYDSSKHCATFTRITSID